MRPLIFIAALLWLVPGVLAQSLKLEKTISSPPGADVQFAEVSPKGDLIAGGCKDGRVRVWSFPAGELKQVLDLTDERISGAWFSNDGSLLAVGGARGTVKIWQLPSGKLKLEFKAAGAVAALAISPDRQMLALASSSASTPPAELWDLSTGKEVTDLPAKFGESLAVAFSPDSQRLAIADADTEIRIFEAQTGAIRATNDDFLLEPFALAFSADGKSVFVGGADKTISVVDAATGKITGAFPKQTFVLQQLQVSRDGKFLAAAYFDETSFRNPAPVLLWNVAAQKVQSTILQPDVTPNGGGFVPDGRLLVTSSSGDKLKVWSVR
jgi:WD40 repeat protein